MAPLYLRRLKNKPLQNVQPPYSIYTDIRTIYKLKLMQIQTQKSQTADIETLSGKI